MSYRVNAATGEEKLITAEIPHRRRHILKILLLKALIIHIS
jgi:hypothetical protein